MHLQKHKIVVVIIMLAILLVGLFWYKSSWGCAESFANADTTKNAQHKNDNKENNIVKLAIYHMQGCGHCHKLMKEKQNGKTIFEDLQKRFGPDPTVKILDFEHGKDDEAKKYNAFPVIKLITPTKEIEYRGPRSANDIERFIKSNLNQ